MRAVGVAQIFSILLFSLLVACEGDKKIVAPEENGDELTYTAEDTLEAQALACWFTPDLIATDSLFSELLYSINYLRYVYGDSFSVLMKTDLWLPGVLAN
jgi:hypothetical protein